MAERKTFAEILEMIKKACNHAFYNGAKDEKGVMIQCATQIYLAQERGELRND